MPPAACGLLSVSRGSIAQVVGHAPQHSQNTPFSCWGVASGDVYALDPGGRQIIDTATPAGALGYLTALPPSSGLPLSSAPVVDAIPCSLNLSHSAGPSLLGGVGMSQSGVSSPVLSGAPDPLGTSPRGLTYQAGSQGSVGAPSYAHAPGVHQPYSLPQGPLGPSFSSCSISAHAGVVCAPSVGAVSVSYPAAGGPVSVLHNSASLSTSASMSPSPVEGKHSFHFSDSDFAAMPLVDSTAAADMQCPEMAPKIYNMRGPHEITRDMHTSGLSVVDVDVHR